MNTLRPAQKEKVKQFLGFTSSSEKSAIRHLKNQDWNLEAAVDAYYSSPDSASTSSGKGSLTSINTASISSLFDKYKDPSEDIIGVEGTEKLCNDLGVDPTEAVTLVLAWHLGCQNMCEFTRQGWMEGWTKLRCDTLDKMKAAIPSFRGELSDDAKFKEIYRYTFNFAKSSQQKSLALEIAVAFWNLLLQERYKNLDLWIDYVQNQYGKAISRDTWNLFLDFALNINDDFSNHDVDGAWPVLIDSFVEYARNAKQSK